MGTCFVLWVSKPSYYVIRKECFLSLDLKYKFGEFENLLKLNTVTKKLPTVEEIKKILIEPKWYYVNFIANTNTNQTFHTPKSLVISSSTISKARLFWICYSLPSPLLRRMALIFLLMDSSLPFSSWSMCTSSLNVMVAFWYPTTSKQCSNLDSIGSLL